MFTYVYSVYPEPSWFSAPPKTAYIGSIQLPRTRTAYRQTANAKE